jgi:peptide/nickel transport system substrate-binding protein
MSTQTPYWKRAANQRITRRRGLIAGGTTLAASILAACSGSSNNKSGSKAPAASTSASSASAAGGSPVAVASNLIPPGLEKDHPLIAQYHWSKLPFSNKTPKPGGRLRMQMLDPGTWDTTDPSAQVAVSNLIGYWANRLLRPDGRLTSAMAGKNNLYQNVIDLDLAASFEQPDQTTYVFKLKDNVHFHNIAPVNGRVLTSADIKFSLDTYASKNSTGTVSIFRDVKSIDAPDASSVIIKTNKPVAYFVNDLSSPLTPIVPNDAFADKSKWSRQPIGTGPFTVKEYVPQSKIVMDRNPNYFVQGLPYFDGVDHAWLADPASVTAAFRTKQIDFAVLAGQDQLEDLLKTEKGNMAIHVNQQNTGGLQYHVGWDLTNQYFSDVRVRRALTLAVDRAAMATSVYKIGHSALAVPTDWTLWPYQPAASEYGQWYAYDPTKAKQLLQAAGVPSDFKTKLRGRVDPKTNDIAALLLEYWKKVGITVEYEPMEDSAFYAAYYAKDIPGMTIEHGTTAGFDLDDFTYRLMRTNEPNNLFKIADPELDMLLDQQQAVFERASRQKLGDAIVKRDFDQIYRSWNICWYYTEVKRPELQGLVAADLYWWGHYWGSTQQQFNWFDR